MSVHSDVMNGHLSWHYLPVAGRIIKDINGVTRRNLWNMDLRIMSTENVWQELPKQEIVVKDSGNDQNIYQKNSVAEVEIQQKPEVLKSIIKN